MAGERVQDEAVLLKFATYWFDKRFLEGVRYHPNILFEMPVGSSQNDNEELDNINILSTKMRYKQENRETCLYSGAASALHHIGLEEAARHMESFGRKMEQGIDIACQLESLHKQIKRLTHGIVGGQMVYYERPTTRGKRRFKKKKRKWNLYDLSELDAEAKTDLWVLILNSVNKCGAMVTTHSVTVWNEIVFDSSQEHCLRLTPATIKYCANTRTDFHRIYYALRFSIKRTFKNKMSF